MSVEGRDKFLEWHAKLTAEGYVFDSRKELLEYCKSDVKLLKDGCMTFKRDFEVEAGFHPFECMTIVSACNRFLRTHCLDPNTIAVEPLRGWGGRKVNQSQAAFEWLTWECHLLDRTLRHAHNRGESHPLPGCHYTVDGYDEVTNTVYEFDGCFWHGCPKCFPHKYESHSRHLGRTMEDLLNDREEKHQLLRQAGYRVLTKWECEWKNERTANPDIQQFLRDHHVPQPIDPREVFFGGRTNAYSLYYKVQEGEEVHYYDFKSFYPFVNKYGRYPVGHPTIVTQPPLQDVLDRKFFGLVRCTVVPPPDLIHPVLPYRCSAKLTFPLCRTCVRETIDLPLHTKQLDACRHGDAERALTGTWCTLELYKALDKGYHLIRADQVYHWDEETQTRVGLFGPYINLWLKKKEEASGYPPNVRRHTSNAITYTIGANVRASACNSKTRRRTPVSGTWPNKCLTLCGASSVRPRTSSK